MADRAKFLDFLDMIDGGGAGKMGDKFQGGGIFSMLANAIATPYGSEDEGRKRARMQAYGLLGDKAPAASIMSTPVPAVQPVMRPKPRPDNLNVPITADPRGFAPNTQPTFSSGAAPVTADPRGFAPNTQPTFSTGRQYNPAPSYANMPMGEAGRGMMPAQAAQPMLDRNMMIGVLERAGVDRGSLDILRDSTLQGLYNQYTASLRSRGRGM
jgi:hypothetical protein